MGKRLTSPPLPFYIVLVFEPWGCIFWSKRKKKKTFKAPHTKLLLPFLFLHPQGLGTAWSREGLVGCGELWVLGQPLEAAPISPCLSSALAQG